jgi:predicted ATPase
MRRFIITGAPGAGKTAIIRELELDGFSVVEEAATDVIADAPENRVYHPLKAESRPAKLNASSILTVRHCVDLLHQRT